MDKLNLSLDEMIKQNPRKPPTQKPTASGKGASKTIAKTKAPQKKAPSRPRSAGVVKPSPGVAALTLSSMVTAARAPAAGLTTGTKLRVGNLDLNVTQEDLTELFQEYGKVKSVELQTKANGKSKGLAHVVYVRKVDAQKAIDTLNGVPLDGRPLKIAMFTPEAPSATAASIAVRVGGTRSVVIKPTPAATRPISGKGRAGGKGRGKGRGGRGGRGGTPPKAEDLDADLDAYRSAAA